MSKKQSPACPVRKTSIGGQALMEGIMMRGPKTTAMAVRNPQGEIVLEKFPTVGKKRPAICRWPIIRGVFGFIDSMTFGYKCLMRSAEISGLEEIEAEMEKEKAEKKAAKKAAKEAAKAAKNGTAEFSAEPSPKPLAETVVTDHANPVADTSEEALAEAPSETVGKPVSAKKEKKESSAMMTVIMVISVVIALAIAIGLFMVLPAWLYDDILAPNISWIDGENRFAQSVFEGVLRVVLLLAYMSLMLLMKDIRRTFQFHGAEHKTIFCYEHGLELTVENIRKERRFHPRCGTSFLILMMIVSIVVGFFIPADLPTVIRVLCKIAVFPLIMGLGYELIKFCGRHDNWLTRIISLPGVWLQHITVLEPDDSMIECAIVAMKEAIPEDESDAW
ncbi:MAG: DUF1385 domain-containing protein [Clostridia bacterium]|nr:DUF1385 domain-containing protein [Clostridia bacterium]